MKAKAIDTIVMFRGGKQVVIESGTEFEATKKELDEIAAVNRDAFTTKVERDLNETSAEKAGKSGDAGPSTGGGKAGDTL